METNLISHIYNEEYLLPFWLEHHKNMFDNIIIVDYRSTDKSIEICKTICPKCKIITTRNELFDSQPIDDEIMDIENDLVGIKMVLNTTEFLFCKTPIKETFSSLNEPVSLAVAPYGAYSKNEYENIKDYKQYIKNFLNDDVVYNSEIPARGLRQIHTFKNGNYELGRHGTKNPSILAEDMYIIWVGFFPLNDTTLKRKLQIKKNISENDKKNGLAGAHFLDEEKLLNLNKDKNDTGVPLKEIQSELYELVKKKTETIEEVFMLYNSDNASENIFLFCFFIVFLLIFIKDTFLVSLITKTLLMYKKKLKNLYNNYI